MNCRRREKLGSHIGQVGHDVLVSDLGGRNGCLFGLCEEGSGGDCEGVRYVGDFFFFVFSHWLKEMKRDRNLFSLWVGDHGNLFLTMTEQTGVVGEDE